MSKLAALFATTAFALSGAVLADNAAIPATPGANAAPQAPDDSQAPLSTNPTKGFVVIQRNVYVPVDEEGNATSKQLIVVDRQGYVTAEEMAAQAGKGDDGADSNANPAANDGGAAGNEPGDAANGNGGTATDNGGMGNAQPAPTVDGNNGATPRPVLPWMDALPGGGRGPLIES